MFLCGHSVFSASGDELKDTVSALTAIKWKGLLPETAVRKCLVSLLLSPSMEEKERFESKDLVWEEQEVTVHHEVRGTKCFYGPGDWSMSRKLLVCRDKRVEAQLLDPSAPSLRFCGTSFREQLRFLAARKRLF